MSPVTFDQFNVTLLNKSIAKKKKKSTDLEPLNGTVHAACSRNCEYRYGLLSC